jgi:HEPN domain-containing protein
MIRYYRYACELARPLPTKVWSENRRQEKTMFRKLSTITIFLLVICLLPSQLVIGQTQREAENSLQRFNQRLEAVRELVSSFNNQRARDLVNRAETLRNEAVAAGKKNDLQTATAKLKMAFSFLDQAVKVTLEGPITRMRSQLEERLQNADQVILGSRNQQAQKLLQEAKANRDKAEQAVSAQQINKAVEYYRVALTLVNKAYTMVNTRSNIAAVDSHNPEDVLNEERRKFDNLRDRASDKVQASNDTRVKQTYDQALKLARSAEEAFRQGNLELARKFYNQSTLLLVRTVDLSSSVSANINRLELEVNRLRDLLDESEERIMQNPRPRARNLFERARRFFTEAENAARAGKTNSAVWKLRLTENMLKRAVAVAENKDKQAIEGRVLLEIENTRMEISDVRKKSSADSPQDAEILLRMAQQAIDNAEKAANSGFHRLALEAVLVSQRFLTRANRILTSQDVSPLSRDRIAAQLRQLDAALSDAETEAVDSRQGWRRRLLRNARDIRNLAYESSQTGNYRAASEAIQVALELTRKSMAELPSSP